MHVRKQNDSGSNGMKVTTKPVSSTSGLPCTFTGGMQAIANGCAAGLFSASPVAGCVTEATKASALHTAGCYKVETSGNTPKKN